MIVYKNLKNRFREVRKDFDEDTLNECNVFLIQDKRIISDEEIEIDFYCRDYRMEDTYETGYLNKRDVESDLWELFQKDIHSLTVEETPYNRHIFTWKIEEYGEKVELDALIGILQEEKEVRKEEKKAEDDFNDYMTHFTDSIGVQLRDYSRWSIDKEEK